MEGNVEVNVDFNEILSHFNIPSGSREDFVRTTLQHYLALGYNVFVCHPNHSVDAAQPNTSIRHRHFEVPRRIGTIGFDVYVIRRGYRVVATNHGDGGFSNWGVGGVYEDHGKTVIFH